MLGAPALANSTGPSVMLEVTGGGASGPIDVPVSIDKDGNAFVENWSMTTAEWQITLNAFLEPDPQFSTPPP